MELLAPAGNMEQAISSINAGCDALYGGLEKWNARINAKNFTIEEYNNLMKICRGKGIKFYMTLNTLFKDNELDDVIKLFNSNDFIKPDAIIVADIGLISVFSTKFPGIDIHVSTQFGVCGIEDIEFLDKFGIKRVILSRELTLDQISDIRKKTNIEIEVFVYGSQCLCFSGQCLWSGLTQESSGNRGRCTAPCRDFYYNKDRMGQFFYPQDINAEDIINSLKEIGINSLKIEGRFRDSKQTALIVNKFRNAIDESRGNTKLKSIKYVGYLANIVPVESMFHVLNPRTRILGTTDNNFGENDFRVEISNMGEISTVIRNQENDAEKRYGYIKTIVSTGLDACNSGCYFELKFDDNELKRILFTDNLRNQYLFELDVIANESGKTVHDIIEILNESVKNKIIEITSNIPEFSVIRFSKELLHRYIDKVNHLCESTFKSKTSVNKIFAPNRTDLIQINSSKKLAFFREKGFQKFVYEITSKSDFLHVINTEDKGCSIAYKLPLLDYSNEIEKIIPLLNGKTVIISRFSHLLELAKINPVKIIADYTVNAWNKEALKVLKEYNCLDIIAHPELSMEYSLSVVKECNMRLFFYYLGRVPIGYTRACFGEIGMCSRECGHTSFSLTNVTKKYDVMVWCTNELGYRILSTSYISVAIANISNNRIYNFSYVNDDEISCVMNSAINNEISINSIYERNVL